MKQKRSFLFACVACLSLGGAAPSLADDPSPQAAEPEPAGADLLALDLEELLNVKVTTASKFSESLADAAGIVSVVTRDELRRFGGITLREVLERAAGLTGVSTTFDRSVVAIRGIQTRFDGSHVLILINGRPTRETLQGGAISDLLEAFPVGVLERIEIVKGPGSVLYGTNAFTGVINLITREASRNAFSLTALGGEQGTRSASGFFTLNGHGVEAVGGAQFRRRPDWSTAYLIPDFFTPPPFGVSALPFRIADQAPGGYLGLNYRGWSFMSAYTSWEMPSFIPPTLMRVELKRRFADLGYRFRPRDQWEMSFNGTYTRTDLRAAPFPSIRRRAGDSVLEWANAIQPSSRSQVTVGALYNYIHGEEFDRTVTPPDRISGGNRSAASVYAQMDYRLSDELKILGGFQAIKIGRHDIHPVPRLGLVWSPAPRWTAKALYGRAFRAPSLNETNLNFIFIKGNPSLDAEQIGTLDLEVAYQGRRVQTGVSFFDSRQDNIIVQSAEQFPLTFANLDRHRFDGIEWEGKYYATASLFFTGSVLRQWNRDGNGNSNVAPTPNFLAKAGIGYLSEGKWSASLFDSYQGPIDGYSGALNPQPRAFHMLNSDFRLELSRYFDPNGGQSVALVVHGVNLANRQVWLPDWSGFFQDTFPAHRGRTVYFGLEFSLNGE